MRVVLVLSSQDERQVGMPQLRQGAAMTRRELESEIHRRSRENGAWLVLAVVVATMLWCVVMP